MGTTRAFSAIGGHTEVFLERLDGTQSVAGGFKYLTLGHGLADTDVHIDGPAENTGFILHK